MFANKIKKEDSDQATVILVVVIVIVLGALIARFVSLDYLNKAPPLLPDTPAMVEVSSLEKIKEVAKLPVYEPTDTFSARGVKFGVFKEPFRSFPRGATVAIYAIDRHYAFQIEQYPNKLIEELQSRIDFASKEEIKINDGRGVLLRLNTGVAQCFESNKEQIGRCQVNTVLLVQKPGMTVALTTDGRKITEGQLIEMGRSLKKMSPVKK